MEQNEYAGGETAPGELKFSGTAYPAGADGARAEPAPGFSALRDEDPAREDTPRDPFSPDDPRRPDEDDARQGRFRPVSEDEEAADGEEYDENGLPLTEEEKEERRKPVAAVPPSVSMDEIEPVEGFRLPRDQPEAEQARQQAEAEAQDASRPEVAQRLADEARERADAAREEADQAQARADKAKRDYQGPDRPPLHEGWRYKQPEPGPHDPA